MKLVTLTFIVVSALTAAAQNATTNKTAKSPIHGITVMPPDSIVNMGDLKLQTGCPIAFTEVALKRNARYMPVKQSTASDGSLAFNYKNLSGKQIESISVRVELKVKKSIYDLDAITITRDMTLTGHSGEVLPLNMLAYGLVRVTLEQVTYVNGEAWTSAEKNNCNYQNPASAEQIQTLK